MQATAVALLLVIAQAPAPSGITLVQGSGGLCMYQPGVPKPAATPGPGAIPLLVTAQAEAANDAAARSAAQLNWSRKVQGSFGPAFASLAKARQATVSCRDAGAYLSTARSCQVQAQPCN